MSLDSDQNPLNVGLACSWAPPRGPDPTGLKAGSYVGAAKERASCLSGDLVTRSPLQGSFKGDVDVGIDIDVDIELDDRETW